MPPFRTLLAVCAVAPAFGWASPKMVFDGAAQVLYAEHTSAPLSAASERASVNGEQKVEFSDAWKAALGGFFWYDNVYNANRNTYPQTLRDLDTYEGRLQNAYIEYSEELWDTKIGNSQVVWGETFGNSPSDIVNPKDFREGIPLNVSTVRRAVPMVDTKLLIGHFSIEGVYIPNPEFNIMPLPGSDYGAFVPSKIGFRQIIVDRERRLSGARADAGARLSDTIGATDLSLIYFEHFDREPAY
jgi:hypothetical protein